MKSVKNISLIASLTMALISGMTHAETKLNSTDISSLATIAAIDSTEIMLGTLAANKKTSSAVADYGKMMISMHGDNLTNILNMLSGTKLKSWPGGEAEKIKSQIGKDLLKIGVLSGTEFDKAYIGAMVKGHQDALTLIDTKLLKNVKTPEIKQFLTDTRGVVIQHLDEAKKIQSGLQG